MKRYLFPSAINQSIFMAVFCLSSIVSLSATFKASLPDNPQTVVLALGETFSLSLPEGTFSIATLPDNEYQVGNTIKEYKWSISRETKRDDLTTEWSWSAAAGDNHRPWQQ